MLSDESSSDSDTGRRFKTDSTRRQATNTDEALLGGRGGRGGPLGGGQRDPGGRFNRDFDFSRNRHDRDKRDRPGENKSRTEAPSSSKNGSRSAGRPQVETIDCRRPAERDNKTSDSRRKDDKKHKDERSRVKKKEFAEESESLLDVKFDRLSPEKATDFESFRRKERFSNERISNRGNRFDVKDREHERDDRSRQKTEKEDRNSHKNEKEDRSAVRSERDERSNRNEKVDRSSKIERDERFNRNEREDRFDRNEKDDRGSNRIERDDRYNRSEKDDKSSKFDRDEKYNKNERDDRGANRNERDDRNSLRKERDGRSSQKHDREDRVARGNDREARSSQRNERELKSSQRSDREDKPQRPEKEERNSLKNDREARTYRNEREDRNSHRIEKEERLSQKNERFERSLHKGGGEEPDSQRFRVKSPVRFNKSPSLERGVKRISSTDRSSKKMDVKKREEPVVRNDAVVEGEKINREDDLEDTDTEVKPTSYYNMLSDAINNLENPATKQETIDVPDSDDEVALRRKLLLVELKKVKEKKAKSKHKEKRRHKKRESDSVSEISETNVDDMNVKVTIDTTKKTIDRRVASADTLKNNESKSKNVSIDESNEEGEIVSDSDEKPPSPVKGVDSLDLRHRLGRHIGPALPAAGHRSGSADLRDRLHVRGEEGEVSGPALPPHMRRDARHDLVEETEGPKLPPHLMKSSRHVGPSIPPEMRKKLSRHQSPPQQTLSLADQHDDISDDDDPIGPMPAGSTMTHARRNLEERALRIRLGELEARNEDGRRGGREEWMTRLPEAGARLAMGLEARQFRARAGPDMTDRSSWTDTPHDKEMKALGLSGDSREGNNQSLQREAELDYIRQRDLEQERAARKHKKKSKRDVSLVDMHQKKIDKKKKKEEKEAGGPVRRRFDRDIDLKANRFDEAQKKSIMKKAQLLDTRFSSGQSKFL